MFTESITAKLTAQVKLLPSHHTLVWNLMKFTYL